MKKNNLTLSLFVFFFLSCHLSFGQANNVRGMYVKDIHNWLGDIAAENAILSYAQGNAYTYITFYDLGSLNFSNTTTKNQLASFMHRARTQYGLVEMGAAGENSAFFSNNIIPFNNGRSLATEKFDVLNFEFEFWVSSSISSLYCSKYLSPNGFSCDTSGAYKFAKREVVAMAAIANANGLISEMYLGWPNKGQIQDVANTVDRILLHAYRPNDADVYQYSRNRLIDAASTGHSIQIIPLYSAESAFMGPWLNSHSIAQPYQTYSAFYAAETGSWKQNINLQGYHWFTYTELPKTVSAVATISANGPTTFCAGGSVTLTANSGNAYLWSPGGQTTRSIVVTQAGTYTVRVTNASGSNVTSSPLTVSIGTSTTSPTITASGPTTFCSSTNVTLTSSSASTYLWSNGATTQAITVNQSGNYTVSITSGTCTGISAPTVVNATAAPAVPTITASGPLTMCSGSTVTLTASTAAGYLWSTGQTSASITVGTSGTYWVRVFSSGNCFNQSTDILVNATVAPTAPVITANGPLNLCPGSSIVLSTAYNSAGYLWSTGETTQTITVQNAGSYWVRISNGANCTAQSVNTVVTVNSNTTPVISASGSLDLCSGNSVTLTSTSSGNYLWSNGETSQSIIVSTAGSYWVSVGTGNCTVQSANVTVTTNGAPVPQISTSASTDLCPGSSVTLTASSAAGYLWSNGEITQSIVVSTGGSYWVRGYVSGNCFAQSTSLIVTELAAPTRPAISANGPLALTTSNPTVILTSSTANSYTWNNGASTPSITVINAGTYFVTVTGSNGCAATSSPVIVTSTGCVPPPIPVISLSGSPILQPGQTVTLTSTPGTGYLWSTNETTQSIVVSTSGIYSVRTYDGASCFSLSLPIAVIENTTGVDNVENASNFMSLSVYPNPGRDQLTFTYMAISMQDVELILCDITGREMERFAIKSQPGENKFELNVSHYPHGVYFAYLLTKSEKQITKLILQ